MAPVVGCLEIRGDLAGCGVKPPVIKDQRLIPVDLRRLGLLHDQGAVQSARDLLDRAVVRVVPVGAGIRCHEIVEELGAACDRRLRQAWNTIHRIRDPHSVPVDRRGLRQGVSQPPGNAPTLRHLQHRARHRAADRPHFGFRIARRRKLNPRRAGLEQTGIRRRCDKSRRRCRRERGR